jgi:selenocysteine-specific elongation factor
VTGQGLDELRAAITALLAEPAPARREGAFRMPVDRAFVMRGHGTVVTGTAIAGVVHDGDTLRVLPGSESVRVRGLEVHGTAMPEARAGQRVAMNLAGVERETLGRGHVVCDSSLTRTSDRLDAWVEIRPAARRPVESHRRVRLHLGTADVLGKLVVLGGAGAIAPRSHGWAQLVLREPVLALRGDRFVLRDETARWTIGGGIVVHPFAERHRAADAEVVGRLERLRTGSAAVAAATFVEMATGFAVGVETLAHGLDLPAAAVRAALADAGDVLAMPDAGAPDSWTTTARWAALERLVLDAVARTHREHPLEPGLEMESLRTGLPWDVSPRQFRWCIERLVAAGRLVRDDSVVREPAHRVQLGREARELGERLEQRLAAHGFTPPDLKRLESELGVSRATLGATLGVLETERRVVRVGPDLYFAAAAADEARRRLAEHCRAHGGITAAEFRDLIGASRKFAIAFLDWCDRTGVTLRVGDVRKLRAG